ncbi:hypothetical protein LINPERPRIM_LOCUS10946 [Linum perenne]
MTHLGIPRVWLTFSSMLADYYIRVQGGPDMSEMAYVPSMLDEPTVVETIDEAAAFVEPIVAISKGVASDALVESVREYKVWSKLEERTLMNCMIELSEKRVVEKGNFKLTGLKELERMMHTRLEHCTLLASHPKASGLNNKPLPFFEELCKVFVVDHAHGLDAVQAVDAAIMLEPLVHATEFVGDYTPSNAESYTFPPNLDHEKVMEELINQGLDFQATGLKHVEVRIVVVAAKGKVKGSSPSSGMKQS